MDGHDTHDVLVLGKHRGVAFPLTDVALSFQIHEQPREVGTVDRLVLLGEPQELHDVGEATPTVPALKNREIVVERHQRLLEQSGEPRPTIPTPQQLDPAHHRNQRPSVVLGHEVGNRRAGTPLGRDGRASATRTGRGRRRARPARVRLSRPTCGAARARRPRHPPWANEARSPTPRRRTGSPAPAAVQGRRRSRPGRSTRDLRPRTSVAREHPAPARTHRSAWSRAAGPRHPGGASHREPSTRHTRRRAQPRGPPGRRRPPRRRLRRSGRARRSRPRARASPGQSPRVPSAARRLALPASRGKAAPKNSSLLKRWLSTARRDGRLRKFIRRLVRRTCSGGRDSSARSRSSEHVDVGAPETVDALVRVADGQHRADAQPIEEGALQPIGVLELVDHEPGLGAERSRAALNQPERQQFEIGEVEHPALRACAARMPRAAVAANRRRPRRAGPTAPRPAPRDGARATR